VKHSGPGISARDVYNISRSIWHDDFNRVAADTEVWTDNADGGGSFNIGTFATGPTAWDIKTGNVIDEDSSINGDATKNRRFTPYELEFNTVTWETILALISVVDISAMWGLLSTVPVSYAEPTSPCAHFIADPAITNTFRARSYAAAEEETDTLVALDTSPHTFKIVWTSTSVLFYIDDVLVATHAAQVPNIPLVTTYLIRTEAAAEKIMRVCCLHVELS